MLDFFCRSTLVAGHRDLLLYGVSELAVSTAGDAHGPTVDFKIIRHRTGEGELDDVDNAPGFQGLHKLVVAVVHVHVNLARNHSFDAESLKRNYHLCHAWSIH